MTWRLISLLTLPLMAFAIWGLIRQVRRALPVRARAAIIGLVMSPLLLIVNIVVLRRAVPGSGGLALLVFGLGFGVAWGQNARLERQGDVVVARRSVLHLGFWAISIGVTQLLATFASAQWVALGLVSMFFTAGTSIGTNLNLLFRQQRLRRGVSTVASSVSDRSEDRAGPVG